MRRAMSLGIALLAMAAVGLGAWGIEQYRTAETLRRHVISGQQRAMYEVVSKLSDIEVRLGKLLVSAGAAQGEKLLGDLQHQAEDVQTNLSQLPLSHRAVSGTIKFVNQLSDYAGVLSQSVTQGRPLSDQDLRQLEEMMNNCALLNQQMREIEGDISSGKALGEAELLFWQDPQENAPPMELAAGSKNGIEYPSLVYDGPFSDGRHQGPPLALAGMEEITAEQAMEIAADFVGWERVRRVGEGVNTQGVIPTDQGERLCYEFGGTWAGRYYLVYIDAIHGIEVNILQIIDTEGGRLSA